MIKSTNYVRDQKIKLTEGTESRYTIWNLQNMDKEMLKWSPIINNVITLFKQNIVFVKNVNVLANSIHSRKTCNWGTDREIMIYHK